MCRSDESGCQDFREDIWPHNSLPQDLSLKGLLNVQYNLTGRKDNSSNMIMNKICLTPNDESFGITVMDILQPCTDFRYDVNHSTLSCFQAQFNWKC